MKLLKRSIKSLRKKIAKKNYMIKRLTKVKKAIITEIDGKLLGFDINQKYLSRLQKKFSWYMIRVVYP